VTSALPGRSHSGTTRCDWSGRNRLITTRAVRHLAIATCGSDRWRHVVDLSRYLSVLCWRLQQQSRVEAAALLGNGRVDATRHTTEMTKN